MNIPALAAAILLPVCGLAASALAQAGTLTDDVQRLISRSKLGNAVAGVSIYDTTNDVSLAAVRADRALIPASNMKLLSSGMAMLVLGPDFVFRTELSLVGDRLVVRGSGDPALADPEVLSAMQPALTVGDVLDVLGGAVARGNVGTIRELVIDDRVFDRQFVHPSWPVEQLNRAYCAEVAGLNFHANVIAVFPRPGQDGPGTAPSFRIEPVAPWVAIENRARTVAQGQNTVWLSRDAMSNRFTLRGEVRTPATAPVEVTVHNVPEFFGQLMAQELRERNVPFSGDRGAAPASGVRLALADESLSGGRALAVITTPLTEALRRCNADSANMYAEALFKRSGQAVTGEPGSWANGAAVLRMLLTQKLGPEAASSTSIADGSGLSRLNAVTPTTFTRWLNVLADDPTMRESYIASLAEPGEGTLRRRFANARLTNELAAKSGYIRGVRCLSGYVIDERNGRRVAFSVLVNDAVTGEQDQAALQLHEDVVKLIDQWLVRQARLEQPQIGG